MKIETASLTKFGNMTVISPGLACLFDGDTATSARSDGVVGWAGVSFTCPVRIDRVEVTGVSGLGFDSTQSTYSVRLRLWARQGTAPANSTDGLCLADVSFTDANLAQTVTLLSGDKHTEWDHAWITVNTGGGYARVAEIAFFEATALVVPPFAPLLARPPLEAKTRGPVTMPVVGPPYDHRVFASVFIPDILENDILEVEGEFQVTSEHNFEIMCSSCLVLALSPQEANVNNFEDLTSELDLGEVVKINNHNGQNFNRSEHHYTKARVGRIVFSEDAPNGLFLNFVIWTASTAAQPGDIVTLNSAFLWAQHFRRGVV